MRTWKKSSDIHNGLPKDKGPWMLQFSHGSQQITVLFEVDFLPETLLAMVELYKEIY